LSHGARVNLITEVKQASGVWKIAILDHFLESETPNGQWHSAVRANLSGARL